MPSDCNVSVPTIKPPKVVIFDNLFCTIKHNFGDGFVIEANKIDIELRMSRSNIGQVLSYSQDKYSPKENFQTVSVGGGDGVYFPLGHYKAHTQQMPTNTKYNDNFLMHQGSSLQENYGFNPSSSLSETRFKKGFYRRSTNNIVNPVSEEYKLHDERKAVEKAENASKRSELIRARDCSHGYNLITGESYTGINVQNSERKQGKKNIPDNLSAFTMKMGKAALKESSARYHAPLGSGANFEKRQNILLNEGVFTRRTSSIIELGKSDIPSFGVEDQFSKSQYTNNSLTAQTGLSETRQVGKYTPKKQINNPSGNDRAVHYWTQTVSVDGRLPLDPKFR